MKAIGVIASLLLFSQAGAFDQQTPSVVSLKDSALLTSIDSAAVAALVSHFRWNYHGPSGGSAPSWTYPASYRGHLFVFQGVNDHANQFDVRIQRHPTVTQPMVDWSKTVDTNKLGLNLDVQLNWGWEIRKRFDLGSGKTVKDVKKELEAFFKNAIPLVNHLTGGKPDQP